MRPFADLWVGGLIDRARSRRAVESATQFAPKPSRGSQFAQACWDSSALFADHTAPHSTAYTAIDFAIDAASARELTAPLQAAFARHLASELHRLSEWAADNNWRPWPHTRLQVVISRKFAISKSLVPAWYGRAGYAEFPAGRVAAGRAAVMHELAHVFFPNANRFLAEGFAVYLQGAIGGNPAFPNFGRPLHALARQRLQAMNAAAAAERAARAMVRLQPLDAIATPGPLELEVGARRYGEGAHGQACLYPLAGSFVQFLIETRGLDRFCALYAQTPFVPLRQDAGSPDRWRAVYGQSLADLESEWQAAAASATHAAEQTVKQGEDDA